MRYCATGSAVDTDFNVVTVETGGRAPVPTPRLTPITSSCGLCGSAELDALLGRLAPLPADLPRFTAAELASLAESALPGQPLFSTTGAVHGAVALDRGRRGDRRPRGRRPSQRGGQGHRAARCWTSALPAHHLTLAVTSRASFEIVQKAWAAGFAAIVAVSAPTALAVTAARLAGMTLAGFARPGRLNVYAPERLPD